MDDDADGDDSNRDLILKRFVVLIMSTRRLRRPTKRAFRRPVRRLCATQTAFPAASFRPVSRESSTSRATRTAWRTPPRHASRRHGSGRGTPRFSRAKPGEARGGGGFGGKTLIPFLSIISLFRDHP